MDATGPDPRFGRRSGDRARATARGNMSDALAALGALAAAAALGVITAFVFSLVSPRASAPLSTPFGTGSPNDSISASGR